MNRPVILGGARTPFGRINGALASKTGVDLGTIAANAAIDRSGVERQAITHVYFGQVLQAGAGQNPARQVGFGAGLERTATADTVNRVCGSGIRAVELAGNDIRLGHHEVVLAGGMDSMSQTPYALRGARGGYKAGDGALEDLVYVDGLICAREQVLMGVHGSDVAAEMGVDREEQDAWALRSHQRAIAARDSGRFAREIVPVEIVSRKDSTMVEHDEVPRDDTSLEALAKLKPAFGEDGSVTAGNAPGLNDGAAALVVADESWAKTNGFTVTATILASGQSAWDVPYLALTPAMAVEQALGRAGLSAGDLDLVEINEAFASVTIVSARNLGLELEKVNVHGGAIALGHPLAASGARILLSLIESLTERGGGIGDAAICSGGGQGDAIIVKVDAP
ncbi:MAG: acetyl-CoA C-acyltransferase [Chloroflexota bacterium]|nr:acetyl-CoA C-acyltransferase [Chloroflexota bacterium]